MALRPALGKNQFERIENKIRERVSVPGASSRLSGANHMGESGGSAKTYSGVDEDGNTVKVFIYGLSEYGGKDYLPHYDRPTVEAGRIYIQRLT